MDDVFDVAKNWPEIVRRQIAANGTGRTVLLDMLAGHDERGLLAITYADAAAARRSQPLSNIEWIGESHLRELVPYSGLEHLEVTLRLRDHLVFAVFIVSGGVCTVCCLKRLLDFNVNDMYACLERNPHAGVGYFTRRFGISVTQPLLREMNASDMIHELCAAHTESADWKHRDEAKTVAMYRQAETLMMRIAQLRECSTCARCGVTSLVHTHYCSGCRRVAYCSRECQREDWSAHKTDCESMETPLN